MAPMTTEAITTLAPDPKNPRRIKSPALKGLALSLEKFGALDIVFNRRTGQLVSGHQRVAALKAAGATQVERDGDWGFIVHPKSGERFPVRYVDWDVEQQRLANLTANNSNIQGEWTPAALEQLACLGEHVLFQDLQLDALNSDLLAVFTPAGAGDAPGPDSGGAPRETMTKCPKCGFRFAI